MALVTIASRPLSNPASHSLAIKGKWSRKRVFVQRPWAVCYLGGVIESLEFSAPRSAGRAESNANRTRRDMVAALAVLAGLVGGTDGYVVEPPTACAAEIHQTNQRVDEVKAIIENDIRNGQYYVTGNLTRSINNDQCRFTDPTTVVTGVEKYVAAVTLLFDPKLSQQELLSITVTGPQTIEANWRLGGYLKFPWRPHIMPYEGSTRYTLGGLVVSHDEIWSISLVTALLELFTPSWGPHEVG